MGDIPAFGVEQLANNPSSSGKSHFHVVTTPRTAQVSVSTKMNYLSI
jgi:hypothetical protein